MDDKLNTEMKLKFQLKCKDRGKGSGKWVYLRLMTTFGWQHKKT